MKLSAISYKEHRSDPREWTLNRITFGDVNLLVGKNATGKTRTLNIINAFSNLLSGQNIKLRNGEWKAEFSHRGDSFLYNLTLRDRMVTYERLDRVKRGKKKNLLRRTKSGSGTIWAERSKSALEFEAPRDQLVAVARRDRIQHNFFIPLVDWGKSVFHFKFGREGTNTFGLSIDDSVQSDKFDPKDTSNVIGIFKRGEQEFGPDFVSDVITDMQSVAYSLELVGCHTPVGVEFSGPLSGKVLGMYVKEKELSCTTEQISISAGMFAALSLIIQVNYRIRSMSPSCFIIDDIGEGLDFERSCALIRVLIKKAQNSSVQLLMSTNDRFVMNAVPLEMWTVLNRTGAVIKSYNVRNSRGKFERFRFTGLNNFDLFATDYLIADSKR